MITTKSLNALWILNVKRHDEILILFDIRDRISEKENRYAIVLYKAINQTGERQVAIMQS